MAQQTQQEELAGALSEDVFGAGIAKPEEEKALEVMEAQPTIAGSAMQTNGEIGPAAIIPEKTGGAWLVPAVDEQGRMLTREETGRRFAEGTRSGRSQAYGLFEDIEQARTYRQAHMSHEGRVQMRAALAVAKGIPQERVARDKALAERLGVDPLTVHYAHDEAEVRGLEKELEDYEGLQEYASRSQFHAAYVRGDLSQLKAVEDWERQNGQRREQDWKARQEFLESGGWGGEVRAPNTSNARTFNEAVTKSELQAQQSDLAAQWIELFEAGKDEEAKAVLQQIEAANLQIVRNAAGLGPDESFLRRTKVVPAMLEQLYTSLPLQGKSLAAGAAAAGTVLGIGAVTGPGVAGAVPLAGKAFTGAALAASTYGTFYLERNLALADLLTKDDGFGHRLPPDIALEAATLHGAIAAGLETVSEKAFLSAFKKIEKTAGAVRPGVLAPWLRDVAQTLQKDPALRETVRGALSKAGLIAGRAVPYVQRAGKVAAAESFTETTQELSNIASEVTAGRLANERDGTRFKTAWDTPENRTRILESAAGGFWAGLGFGAAPVITSAVYHGVRARSAAQFAQREQERHAVVEQAWTHQNDPDAMRELLETVAPETAQEVVVPLDRAVQLQQSGVDVLTPLGIQPDQAQAWATSGQTIRTSVAQLHAVLNQEQFNAVSQIFERHGESAAENQITDEELARTLRQTLENGERSDAAQAMESWLSPEERTAFSGEVDRIRSEVRDAAAASPNLSAQAEAVGGLDRYLDTVMPLLRKQASMEARRTGQKPADVLRSIAVRALQTAERAVGQQTEEAVAADIEAEFAEATQSAPMPAETAKPVQPAQEQVPAEAGAEQPEAVVAETVPAGETVAPAMQEASAEAGAGEMQLEAEPDTAGQSADTQAGAAPAGRRAKGKSDTLAVSSGDEPFTYEVWELGDLIPSHDPTNGFAKRQDYPAGVQERPYHSDKGEQEKVRRNAGSLDPRYLINTNPDAMSGPPIVTSTGIVLGGNSRTMSIQTAYANQTERAAAYRQAVIDQAQAFGIDPAAVSGMAQPVLVRVVNRDMSQTEMAQASRRYNEVTTQALQSEAEGVSKSKLVSDGTLAAFASGVEDFDTVRDFLSSPKSRDFVAGLMEDGVIEPTQASRLTDAKTGLLNSEGKDLVVNTLRGLVIQDYDIIRKAAGPVLDKVDRAISDLVSLRNRGSQWAKMVASVQEAVNQINRWQASGTDAFPHTLANVHLHFDQGGLIADPQKSKKAVQALAVTLATATPKEFQARVATMEAEAKNSSGKANAMSAMLGAADKPVSPAGAFVRAFLKPVAVVDGKAVRGFDPEGNPAHEALQWASDNSGASHSIETAQNKLTAILADKKASKEEKAVAKERMQILSSKSGKAYAYGKPSLGAFSYRKSAGDVLWQFYGERGIARLDEAEKTTRLADLDVARQMESAGKDAAVVKLATGWERGADGKWRYEMPDAVFQKNFKEKLQSGKAVPLWNLLRGGKNNQLLKAYPQLTRYKIRLSDEAGSWRGYFSKETQTLVLSRDRAPEIESTAYHELQHAIQEAENFSRGGNPRQFPNYRREVDSLQEIYDAWRRDAKVDDFIKKSLAEFKEKKKTVEQHFADLEAFENGSEFAEQLKAAKEQVQDYINWYKSKYGTAYTPEEIYARLIGEVEARNVQKRMGMTPEERRASLASATEDVARKDQILLGVRREEPNVLRQEAVEEHMMELFQRAWHGSPYTFDKFTLDHIGEGEGAQVHGWGLYFAQNRTTSDERYRKRLLELRNRNDFTITENGNKIPEEAKKILQNDLWRSLYDAVEEGKTNEFRNAVRQRIEDLKKGDRVANNLIQTLSNAIEKIDNNPKLSITKFLAGVPADEKARFDGLVRSAKALAKSEGRRATIADVKNACIRQREPFVKKKEQEIANASELEKLDIDSLNVKKNEGQLYEVEIPDDDVLLDEQKRMKEQPEIVQKAAVKLWREALGYDEDLNNQNAMFYAYDGRRLYKELADKLGSSKAASLALKEQGVLGIAYDGMQDGRCFVVWDEDAIQIYNTLYQTMQQAHDQQLDQTPDAFARGAVTADKDNYFIDLFKRADLSTLFHELSHTYFLSMERYVRDGMADAEMQADYETLCKWLNAAPGDALTVEQHEQLARGWEAYLMEGKAPSVELESVFKRICEWFIAIYRSVKALGVELNDDVRAVFDRMLATQEEIEDAAARFELVDRTTGELQAMGMDGAQMAYTRRVLDEARKGAFQRLREQRDADRKARLADYRRLAMSELRGEQVHQARSDMRKTPVDLEAVRALVGDEVAARLQKKQPGTFKKDGGVDPGQFAMEHGYESAEAMLADMDSQPSLGKAVAERVEDLSRNYDQQYSADDALFDSQELIEHASLIGRQLSQIAGRPYVQQQAVQRVATQEMSGRKMSEAMRVGDFRANVRRALRDERRAVANGKFAEALEANTKARLNLEMARIAQNLKEDVDKAAKAAKRFVGSKTVPEVAKAYLAGIVRQHVFIGPNFAESIVSKYGPDDFASWLKTLENDGYTMLIDPDVLAEATPWREMTMEQWQSFADALRQVVVIERNQRKLLTAKGKKDLDEAVEDLAKSLAAHNKAKVNGRQVSDFVRALRRFNVAHMKIEQVCLMMDGGKPGAMWDLIYRPITEAGDAQAVELSKVRDYVRDKLFNAFYTKKEFRELGKKQQIASIGQSLTKEQRLCAALNMGNAVNIERLKTGFGWDDAQLSDVLSVLTAKDWRFVQAVWDYIETFREPAFRVHEQVTGSRPKAVEAKALQVQTADGQTLQLRGGYFPIRYDPVENTTQFERDQKKADEQLFGGRNYGAAQTKFGHLKERAEGGLGTPLLLNFTVLADHLYNTVHDITHRKAVLDVAKVLRNKTAREAIETYAGREQYQELMPWLQDVANEAQGPMTQIQKMANWARSSGTIMQMGYKLTTIAMVPAGYTQSMAELGWGYGLRGIWHAIRGLTGGRKRHEAMRDFVYEKSPFMKSRIQNFDRDIRDFSKKINAGPIAGWIDRLREGAFVPMGYYQLWSVDMPTWWAAYEKGLKENNGNEDMAVAFADSIVRRTQSSGMVKDLSRVQRGSDIHRLLTMFYSYFNTLYNLGAQHIRELREDHSPAGIWKVANVALLLWFLPSVLSEYLAGREPDDDEDWLKWAAKIWIQVPFQTMVGVRDVVQATFSAFDYQLSPAQGAPASLVKFFKSIDKAVEKRDPSLLVKPAAEATGYVLKLPLKQPIITAQNMWEYCTDPRSEFYLRDLFFVKPEKRRKKQ